MKRILMIAAIAALMIAGCARSADETVPPEQPTADQRPEIQKDPHVNNAQLLTYELKVDGMMCDGCRKHVTDILAAQEGVNDVTVDLKAGKAIVHVKPGAKFDEAKAKDALDVDDYKLTACTEITN